MTIAATACTSDADRWCAGLRSSGTRALEAEDCARLKARMRREEYGAATWLIVSLLSVVTTVMLVSRPFPGARTAPWMRAAVAWLSPVSLALGVRRGVRRWRLGKDLQAGVVERFQGPALHPVLVGERVLAFADRAGLRLLDLGEHVLERMPESGTLHRVDTRFVQGWTPVAAVGVAPQPPHAVMAAEWVRPPPAGMPANTPYLHHRALSDGEAQELGRYADTVARRPLGLAVLLMGYLLLAGGATRASTERGDPPGPLTLALRAGVALAGLFAVAARWRSARRIARDREEATVLIVRMPVPCCQGTPTSPVLGPPVEILPSSGVLWTEHGKPASWRLLTSA